MHLSHDVTATDLHSDLAHAKLGRDLFVEKAADNKRHNLAFTLRQIGKTLSEISDDCSILAPDAIAHYPSRIASSNSWSRNGLVRNSTAPDFMACTDIGMSPWAVIKTIGS